MPSTPEWIETALSYASHGFRVVPFHQVDESGVCSCDNEYCETPGDHPRFNLFTQEASRAENTIRSWGDIWPESRIGAVTGFASNLVALEVDKSKGGVESYQALDVPPPATRTAVRVGDLLFRMFFRHPDTELPPRLDIAPGLTLLGDGAAVRLPDKTFHRSRDKYRWKENQPFDPVALPRTFWDAIGVEILPDWPPADDAPTISLPFRRHKKERLTELAQPTWSAYPWAAKGSLTLFVGERAAGKSSLLADLATSVLQGEQSVGGYCRQSAVVYLSEHAPSIFARRLLRHDPDELALRRLSTLFAHDLRAKSWGELMRGCVERATKEGAEMIIIDSIDTFPAISDPPCERNSTAVLGPIYDALARKIAVVCTASIETSGEADLTAAARALGPLGTAADVITAVSRLGDGGQLLLRSLSKFDATPEKLIVQLDAEGGTQVETPGPLFRKQGNGRGARRRSAAEAPDSPEAPRQEEREENRGRSTGDDDLRGVLSMS